MYTFKERESAAEALYIQIEAEFAARMRRIRRLWELGERDDGHLAK